MSSILPTGPARQSNKCGNHYAASWENRKLRYPRGAALSPSSTAGLNCLVLPLGLLLSSVARFLPPDSAHSSAWARLLFPGPTLDLFLDRLQAAQHDGKT